MGDLLSKVAYFMAAVTFRNALNVLNDNNAPNVLDRRNRPNVRIDEPENGRNGPNVSDQTNETD